MSAAEWANWDGRQRAHPRVLASPRSLAELAELVGAADACGEQVRVAGAGHSFTALVPTSGTLISLRELDRVLDIDPVGGRVRVQAGITIAALNRVLDRHGMAFANLGDIDSQTLAGAVATGTHGTGSRLGNLSSQIESLELMGADGQVVVLDERSDPEGLRAARVSLGALGVITALTLRTVPAFRLHRRDGPAGLAATLERLQELADAHDHFEMYWFPYSDTALLRRNDRTDAPARPRSRARTYMEDIVLVNHGLQALSRLGRRHPALIPVLNRTATRLAGSSERVDRSHRIFVTPRLVRFTEMEYAIPREHAATAIGAIRDGIHAARLPVNFPIEVRFVAPDDALLSPAHGRASCYIAVHTYDGMAFEPYFRMVEQIMDGFGGRPHWGKRHFQSAATLAGRYPGWERFQAVRRRLDQDLRFGNDELARVLG